MRTVLAKRLLSIKNLRMKRKRIPQFTKNRVCANQEWNCNFCKNRFSDVYIIDHMIPLWLGGNNDETNLQGLCPSCNKFKTAYIDYNILTNIFKKRRLVKEDVLKAQQNNLVKMSCSPEMPKQTG